MHLKAPLLFFFFSFQLYQEELEWKNTASLGCSEDEAHVTPQESLTHWCPGTANWKIHRITLGTLALQRAGDTLSSNTP